MEAAYALPFDRFERYTPCGPPEAVAEALAPYLAAGCRRFNFVPEATSLPAAMEAAAEVKALLSAPRLAAGRGARALTSSNRPAAGHFSALTRDQLDFLATGV